MALNVPATGTSREEAIEHCVQVIEAGSTQERYDILPEISILRDQRFLAPLLEVLRTGGRKDKEFAALALGALERTESLEVLYLALTDAQNHKGPGTQSLQTAIIVAMGEIGKDSAVDYLRKSVDFTFRGDTFFKGRQRLILSAAGYIAQQGGRQALEFLKEFLTGEDQEMRAHALNELAVAYWHRPNEVPDDILYALFLLMRDVSAEVRSAAIASITNLADLGCSRAEQYLEEPRTGAWRTINAQ